MNWFADFLYLYALGAAGTVALVPERAIGRYFYKFHFMILLAMVIAATAVGRPMMTGHAAPLAAVAQLSALAFSVTVLLVSALIHITHAPLRPDLLGIPISIGVIFAAFEGIALEPGRWEGLLLALHFFTMAAMLGSSLVAMILGHWYLQNAALSFDHLTRLSRLFVGACIAKIAVSGLWAVVGFEKLEPMLSEFDLIFVATRVGAGLVGGLVLALMTLNCAKSKANQSATGILYVAVIFVLVGEIMSMYLTLQRGVPL